MPKHAAKVIKKRLVWLFPAVVLLVITWACLLPPEDFPSDSWFSRIPHADKLVHFLFYAGFCLSFRWALYIHGRDTVPWRALVFLFAAAYGGGIEWLQGEFFRRGCGLADEAANALGALAGTALFPSRLLGIVRRTLFGTTEP